MEPHFHQTRKYKFTTGIICSTNASYIMTGILKNQHTVQYESNADRTTVTIKQLHHNTLHSDENDQFTGKILMIVNIAVQNTRQLLPQFTQKLLQSNAQRSSIYTSLYSKIHCTIS